MEHAIFAIELCARLEPQSQLRHELHEVVMGYGPGLSYQQKWQQYRRAAMALLNNQHLFEKGCWDYFDDDARAQRDYDMWSTGMTTEEGARLEPSGPLDPYRSAPRFMTFTMAFLIVQGSPTDQGLASLCNIPEEALWRRDVFARILQGMGLISFASVKSDVLYMIPRNEDWGLTEQDLAHSKFEYLRPLV